MFYAAAGELLPDAIAQHSVWPVALGGAIGIVAMAPVGIVAASGVDALIDGLVLGLGYNAGCRQGVLLSIALAVEFLFLGLSIAGAFGTDRRRAVVIGAAVGVALAVPLGALLAQPIAGAPPTWQSVAFAFGLIALLYLVTEELLTEAHERPETAWGPALFFVGFLALTILNQLMK